MSRRNTLINHPQSNESLVEWPHLTVSTDQTDNDLGPPVVQLLCDIGVKGTKDDEDRADNASTAVRGLPVSVSIIESGATAASKAWASVIAVLGGGTAVWAAATDFWNGQSPQNRGTLVIAAAIVVAACALGVALIMYGDVRARGQGAAAQYDARAAVTSAFLRGAATVAYEPEPNGLDGLHGHKSANHKRLFPNAKR